MRNLSARCVNVSLRKDFPQIYADLNADYSDFYLSRLPFAGFHVSRLSRLLVVAQFQIDHQHVTDYDATKSNTADGNYFQHVLAGRFWCDVKNADLFADFRLFYTRKLLRKTTWESIVSFILKSPFSLQTWYWRWFQLYFPAIQRFQRNQVSD